jgi:hypothetical protein
MGLSLWGQRQNRLRTVQRLDLTLFVSALASPVEEMSSAPLSFINSLARATQSELSQCTDMRFRHS